MTDATTGTAPAGAALPGLDALTLCEAFQRSAAACGDRPALRSADGAQEIAWPEFAQRVAALAAGLTARGVRRRDTVGLLLTNRPEMALVDVAALHLGATPFSIYNTSAPGQIEYVLGNAEATIVVSETALAGPLFDLRAAGTTALRDIVLVDAERDGALTLAELEAGGAADFDFEATWRAVDPQDIATLIYTSGTTGPPKGVELTHANLMFAWQALQQVVPLPAHGRMTSYLPSAHLADRLMHHYSQLVSGATVTFVPNAADIARVIAEVRPTSWGAVPRVWEKLQAGLEARIAAEPDARRAVLEEALALGVRKVRAEGGGAALPAAELERWRELDGTALAGLRSALGFDQAVWLLCGAAPIPPEVLEFFGALGLPICECWGMSETSVVGTMNPPDGVRIGSVGPPVPGVELELADDGELLVRGPNVMAGYRNDPERTAEAVDADGWMHTGDIAEIDDDGYVRIVDRKKELIINAAGKNMSPANIEQRLKAASPLIGQACAIGDRRPYNVALLVLDPDGAAAWARAHGREDASVTSLAYDGDVQAAVEAAVQEANAQMARVEQIKRWTLLDVDWLPDSDELTPTMKLKRRIITEKYAEEIDALYG